MNTPQPRTDLLTRFLALLVAGLLLMVGAAAIPAGAAPVDIKPKTTLEVTDGDVPNCGSKNLDGHGSDNYATWTVTSSLGNGSKVYVGHEWTLTASIDAGTSGNTAAGDNGPDPLSLTFVPFGPVLAAKPPVGEIDPTWNGGNGWVGPLGPSNFYGYRFDANSSPTLFHHDDGVDVDVTVFLKATAPGQILVSGLEVAGSDGTPSDDSPFECTLDMSWTWTVVEPEAPTSATDIAYTDATYGLDHIEDRNGGSHGVVIDVLSNDNDPNLVGGPGDPAEVRIKDWQPKSEKGGNVSCGTGAQKGETTFAQMSAGTCTYHPAPGATGADAFGYLLRSATGFERYVKVTVHLSHNNPPFASETDFGATPNVPETFPLGTVDPEDDPVICIAEPIGTDGGDLFVNTDCSADWSPKPNWSGTVDFNFVACDQHPTKKDGQFGFIGSKAPGYSEGTPDDWSITTSSRCATLPAKVTVYDGLIIPPVGKADFASVDANYPGPADGPFRIDIPVLANDYDNNGPDPENPGSGVTVQLLDPPGPALGTAEVLPDRRIRFTPAAGAKGWVVFTYRLCEDPLQQLPPYVDDPNTPANEGLPFCGTGKVVTVVVPNQAPEAGDDAKMTLADTPIVDFDVSTNDLDPEGTDLTCIAGPLGTKSPELIAAASIDSDCLLDVTPVPGASGTASIEYPVCDSHVLLTPSYAANPYGEDGRAPGDLAPRCASGMTEITVIAPLVADPVDLDPLPVCASDEGMTPVDVPLHLDVLGNDTDLGLDNQPSPLKVVAVFSGEGEDLTSAGGAVSSPNGDMVLYVPPAGWSGTDSFTYRVADTAGHLCEADVTVEVAGAYGDDGIDPGDDIPVDPAREGAPTGDPPTGDSPTGDSPTGDSPTGTDSGDDTEVVATGLGGDTLPRTGVTVLGQLGAALALIGTGGTIQVLGRRRRS